MSVPKQIEFNRPKKYTYIEELGSGACGQTIRVRDEAMACDFVIKKYKPIVSKDSNPDFYLELLERFRDEARILFRLHHRNVVRVFNFFDYKEYSTSYIIMGYIDAKNILDFLQSNPAAADKVFEGVVEGFMHLQDNGILHRDIRPANILVEATGNPKIIDFGFGKQISNQLDSNDLKSISLNWWCETPSEFEQDIYNFTTEVYFVGKLFQLAINEYGLSEFKYTSLLRKMCEHEPKDRCPSFSEIYSRIMEERFEELAFSESEIAVYRQFSSGLVSTISSFRSDIKFERDVVKIMERLEELYRKNMLEEFLPSTSSLISVFCLGSYKYFKDQDLRLDTINSFVKLLRGISEEKRSVVLENLLSRLDAITKFVPKNIDDEIPF